jgi:Spy/CpxP family protein refolding chaperone
MKATRRRIRQLLLAGAILVAPMAMAQGEKKRGYDKDPKAMAEKRTAQMAETLSLTPEQIERVKAINERHAEKMASIREHQDADERKAAKVQLREWHQGELKNVLTQEQLQRMQELQEQRSESRKGEGRKGEGREMKKSDRKGEGLERRRPANK